ncbi:polysaccharide biosynthesis tyrosine autokinase [Sinomonas sp. P47F7]|uniref:polysaccharide biosynthesis tyrosine autokinase n=1 Tax=Sinomonas sp. P47F7 TaxID=3410987 RepID=UPI003BF52FCC
MVHDDGRNQSGLSLAEYVSIARSYWVGILLLTALATAAGLGWYLTQPRVYEAVSSGIVVSGGADNLSLSLAGDNLAKSKAKGYKSVGESTLVAERVAKTLSLDEPVQAVAGAVTIAVPPDSAELQIKARSADPQQAQRLADAWVVAIAAQVYDLEKPNASPGSEPASKVVPLAKAVLPSAPVSPRLDLALSLGAAIGLVLGLVYAFLRHQFDRRIRSAAEIERLAHLPVVGTLPLDKRLSGGSSVVADVSALGAMGGSGHAMGEALRELRTNLQFIDVDNPPRVLLITSSLPSEGKSTVIGNLAATLAAAGEDVIVVDGDLRRPTVHSVFDVMGDVGLTDVLSGRAAVDDVLQPWGPMPQLQVLSAGRIPPNPSELLGSRAMQQLLKELSQRAIVLVDTPPLLPVTDAAVLARAADGTIVVARARKTTSDNLQRALGNLGRVRGRVLGIILNCVATKGSDAYSYGYYGTYSSGGKEQKRRGRGQPRSAGAAGQLTADTVPEPAPLPHAVASSGFSDTPPPREQGMTAADGPSVVGAQVIEGDDWLPPRVREPYRGRRSAG